MDLIQYGSVVALYLLHIFSTSTLCGVIIRTCWASSANGFGNSNYRSREVGEALRSLDKSRLIQLVYPTISLQAPQEIDFTRKPRLQFLDTGLLNSVLGVQAQLIGLHDLSDFYQGKIIQHTIY